ncbi:MAG: zinc metallopeptidase [Alphaproteobacteria bacterium]|nr:zinc metallopeptidase [Alphaproteobacteria bacterium]
MAIVLIVIAFVVMIAVLPQFWVQRVIARHSEDRTDFPGTGGEFARHILDEMGLRNVGVTETEEGDHYDPDEKVVRLSKTHFRGRSLSAVVIAAHEVGHAIQDASGYPPLRARTQIAKNAGRLQTAATVILMAAPLLVIIAKSPAILLVQLAAIGLIALLTVFMHAVTLPVEFDASFKRALPLLASGRYIPDADFPAARSILRAAALTYVAAAAMSVINIFRWLRFLRI